MPEFELNIVEACIIEQSDIASTLYRNLPLVCR